MITLLLNTVLKVKIADEHIIDESFLEDINCILKSCEVPNLFDIDGNICQRILISKPIVESVRMMCKLQMFPSLVNCCTIDWFDIWSDAVLLNAQTYKQLTRNGNICQIKA